MAATAGGRALSFELVLAAWAAVGFAPLGVLRGFPGFAAGAAAAVLGSDAAEELCWRAVDGGAVIFWFEFDRPAGYSAAAAVSAGFDGVAVILRFEFDRPRVMGFRGVGASVSTGASGTTGYTAAVSTGFTGSGALAGGLADAGIGSIGTGLGAWARAPCATANVSDTNKNAETFTVPPAPAESA